jgi:polar amino acid transport system permease protein
MTKLDFSVVVENLPLLLEGLWLTIFFTLTSLALGIAIGIVVAIFRVCPIKPLKLLGLIYTEAIRGTPLLVLLFILYYALPQIGIRLSAYTAGILGLGINAGAYIAEIFRAGIESVPVGQVEAARSVGMSYGQTMRKIILPQATSLVLPPLTNEAISQVKATSLVSTIAVAELLRAGQQIISMTFAAVEIYAAVAALYLAVNLTLGWLARRLEGIQTRGRRKLGQINEVGV